jgi:GDP-L-fucose synthase
MKKIFVTGGNGLVGQGIKSISSNYNDSYKFIYLGRNDCDLLHYNDTITFFEKHKPDYVIHLAANVGGLFKNMEYPVQMLEDNLLINMNVIKASHCVNVKKLIACLSTCIFPNEIDYPITEEHLHHLIMV